MKELLEKNILEFRVVFKCVGDEIKEFVEECCCD